MTKGSPNVPFGPNICKAMGHQQQQSLCIMATFRFEAMRAYKKQQRFLPQFLGGGCSNTSQVTPHSQLYRLIILGSYTSWNTDGACDNTLCNMTPAGQLSWKHFASMHSSHGSPDPDVGERWTHDSHERIAQ